MTPATEAYLTAQHAAAEKRWYGPKVRRGVPMDTVTLTRITDAMIRGLMRRDLMKMGVDPLIYSARSPGPAWSRAMARKHIDDVARKLIESVDDKEQSQ